MSASLSDFVDNMSAIFIIKKYKKYMERKEINAECKFDGLKDNKLSYKCRECGKNGMIQ